MTSTMRQITLVARTVLIEAVRRREVYLVVLAALGLSSWVFTLNFFGMEGVFKFQREVVLQTMSMAVALCVIVLSARQLPREFSRRTIYPLLAKPVSRLNFLLGKTLGCWMASAFVLVLFSVVFCAGNAWLGVMPNLGLFVQHLWLQMIQSLILITFSFVLSLLLNLDAAIVVGFIFWFLSGTMLSALTVIYPSAEGLAKVLMKVLVFVLPQLSLFDLGAKLTHSEFLNGEWTWPSLEMSVMAQLTLYGLVFASVGFFWAFALFRRRPL